MQKRSNSDHPEDESFSLSSAWKLCVPQINHWIYRQIVKINHSRAHHRYQMPEGTFNNGIKSLYFLKEAGQTKKMSVSIVLCKQLNKKYLGFFQELSVLNINLILASLKRHVTESIPN